MAQTKTMTGDEAGRLVRLEYDLISAGSQLDDLAGYLSRSRLPAVAAESGAVRRAARLLRRVLRKIDPHISDAVAVCEAAEPAPF